MLKPCLLLGLLLVLPVQAEVYRWVDENGRVHFGDKASRAVNAKTLEMEKPATTVQSDADQKDQEKRLLESWQDERAEVAQDKAAARSVALERASTCKKLQGQQASYDAARVLYVEGENGEAVILTDEQRKQEEAKLARALAASCD